MDNRFIDMGEAGENSLAHFGVLGQKWGQRRALGSDGRVIGSKYSTRQTRERAKKWSDKNLDQTISGDSKKRKMSRAEYNTKQAQSAVDATSEIVRTHENVASRRSSHKYRQEAKNMTDQELRDYINRSNLEQSYARMKTQNLDSGRATTSELLDTFGDVLAIGASAATIASTLYMMKNM